MSDRLKFSTTINKESYNKIKKIANEEGRTLNYYLEKGLEYMLDIHEKGKSFLVEKLKREIDENEKKEQHHYKKI